MASLVLLPTETLATYSPSKRCTSDPCAESGCKVFNVMAFEVSVPVLSRQRTSTLLSDSIAFACWTSAPFLTMRTAPREYETVEAKNRPIATMPGITTDNLINQSKDQCFMRVS